MKLSPLPSISVQVCFGKNLNCLNTFSPLLEEAYFVLAKNYTLLHQTNNLDRDSNIVDKKLDSQLSLHFLSFLDFTMMFEESYLISKFGKSGSDIQWKS